MPQSPFSVGGTSSPAVSSGSFATAPLAPGASRPDAAASGSRTVQATAAGCLPAGLTQPGRPTPLHRYVLHAFLSKLAHAIQQSVALNDAARAGDTEQMRVALRQGAQPQWVPTEGLPPESQALLDVATRINRLLPAPSATPDSPIDQALRDYDVPAARQQLEPLGNDTRSRWTQAMLDGREDALRGILAVEPQTRIAELVKGPADARVVRALNLPADVFVGRAHAGLFAGTHGPELNAYLASLPHLSMGPLASHNNGAGEMVCRHFAMAWLHAAEELVAGRAFDYAPFQDKDELLRSVDVERIERQYDAISAAGQEAYLVHNDRIGQLMADQLAGMQPGEGRRLLLSNGIHTMGLVLRREAEAFHAHFYDPNLTTAHASASTADLSEVAGWTLKPFMHLRGAESQYWEGGDRVSLAYALPAGELPETANQRTGKRLAGAYFDDPLHSPEAVRLMLRQGFDGELQGLPQALAGFAPEEAAAIIGHRSGMVTAMGRGDDASLGHVGQVLQAIGPAGDALLERCLAWFGNALHVGDGSYNRSNVIRSMGTLMAAMQMPGERIARTLTYDDDTDTVRLFELLNDPAPPMEAFAQTIRAVAPQLSHGQLAAVLQGTATDGTPALMAALYYGKAEGIRAYGTLLRGVDPPREMRLALLRADHPNFTGGVLNAVHTQQPDAIRAYGDLLADCLEPADRAAMLADTLSDPLEPNTQRPMLGHLLAEAEAPTIQALRDLLANVPFDAGQIERINQAAGRALVYAEPSR